MARVEWSRSACTRAPPRSPCVARCARTRSCTWSTRSAAIPTRCPPAGAQPSGRPDGPSSRARAAAVRRRRACTGTRACSRELASRWRGEVDLVFIDGDHSESGCELDWVSLASVRRARRPRRLPRRPRRPARRARSAGPDGGRQAPFPRPGGGTPGWEIAAEADRTCVRGRLRGSCVTQRRLVGQRAPQVTTGQRPVRTPRLARSAPSWRHPAAPPARTRARSRGGCRGRRRAARRDARVGTSGTSAPSRRRGP